MSSSNSPQSNPPQPAHHSKTPESEETSDRTVGVQKDPAEKETLLAKDSEEPKSADHESLPEEFLEEEEEGECGFCLFMKGGGCKDTFIEWEKCVEEGEKKDEDIADKCFQATAALKKCMEAHPDYYAPLLEAEKAAEKEAAKRLEEEKEESATKEALVSSDHKKKT